MRRNQSSIIEKRVLENSFLKKDAAWVFTGKSNRYNLLRKILESTNSADSNKQSAYIVESIEVINEKILK